MTKRKAPAGKRVNYVLIDRASDEGKPMYKLLNTLVERFHSELTNARIALAWCVSWKGDVDGRVTLGKCRKASDLDRELAPFDFVILLNRQWWRADADDHKRCALLDHELAHATQRLDRDGEPVRDERGRVQYRMRKHDIEDFAEVVLRWGVYRRDLERAAAALRNGPTQQSLLDPPTKGSTTPPAKPARPTALPAPSSTASH